MPALLLALVLAQALPAATGTAAQPWPPAGVSRIGGAGVTPPRMVKETKPTYTTDAMRAKVEGAVVMEVVVRADGTVGDVRVVRLLDKEHGLDDQAVKAVKQWRFVAGEKDGKPVPVLVEIEMTFTLRK